MKPLRYKPVNNIMPDQGRLKVFFRKAVDRFVQDMGNDGNKLLVVSETDIIYVSPALEKLRQDMAPGQWEKTVAKAQSGYETYADGAGLARRVALYVGTGAAQQRIPVNTIALNLEMAIEVNEDLSLREVAMLNHYILDHELGHLYADKGLADVYSLSVAESVAESYANLRHIQRYGSKTDFVYVTDALYAQDIILEGDTSTYCTIPARHKVLEMKNDPEIKNLSPRATLRMASKIGYAYAHRDETLDKICDVFAAASDNHINKPLKSGKVSKATMRLIEEAVAENAKDPDIRAAAQLLLAGFSDDPDVSEMAKDAVASMDKTEAEFERACARAKRLQRRQKAKKPAVSYGRKS